MTNVREQYPHLVGKHYLHVEDDDQWVAETADLFELLDSHPVLTAACEEDILAILADPTRVNLLSAIAFVLCNGQLKNGDFGPNLLPLIRRIIPKGIPIIGHSGYDGIVFMRAGADAFSSKADGPDQFFTTINNVLARSV